MRIAYLVNQYPKVSHSFIRREILALELQGFEIFRISLRGWNEPLRSSEDEVERARTTYVLRTNPLSLLFSAAKLLVTRPLHFLRALRSAIQFSRRSDRSIFIHFAYLIEACHIATLMHKLRIEHIHAHFGTNSAEVAMLVQTLCGLKWSFTVHGPEEFDKATLIHLGEKVRRSSFVVAISSFGRGQLYRLVEPEYWHKIKVVHCGLDASFRSKVEATYAPSTRLVCVGRLCEQKGQLLLVEAAKELSERGTQFELILAGDGDHREPISELINRYNLQSKIRITGWIGAAEVKELILGSRALVLPSLAEGLPVVLMEAMALERPVISTFVAGIPELVISGEHGWLIPAGDVVSLVNTITACIGCSQEVIARMGRAARERVLKRHDIDLEASKLATLFQNCE